MWQRVVVYAGELFQIKWVLSHNTGYEQYVLPAYLRAMRLCASGEIRTICFVCYFWSFGNLTFWWSVETKKNNLIFMEHFSVLCAIVCHSFLEGTFPCTLVHLLLVKNIFSINTTIYLSHKISCVLIKCYSLSIRLVFPRVCILLVSLFQLYIFLRCSPLEAGAS